jgi:multicomponent Na+:H+ antiporter subunit B
MNEKKDFRTRLTVWVNGEREPKDRTLFTMEKQRLQRPQRSEEEHEKREKHRLRKFLNWYPFAAGAICAALTAVLLFTVLLMPKFGNAENPINNEVSEHYLTYSWKETGASNAVTGMILTYRGFDTLGESCVLFLAVTCVMILLGRDENNTDERDVQKLEQEASVMAHYPDVILRQAARLLIPFVFLFAAYVLLNGETSPGGGFSGGTILGCGLILFSAAFGQERMHRFFNAKVYTAVRTFGLLLYAGIYGYSIFIGANGMTCPVSLSMPIDLAVGLVVACTVYGFYALYARGEI